VRSERVFPRWRSGGGAKWKYTSYFSQSLVVWFVDFVEEIIKNRREKRDNTYVEEIKLFYSNSNYSQQQHNK